MSIKIVALQHYLNVSYEESPLGKAVNTGNAQIVESLLEMGASPTKNTENSYSPIHLAALRGHSGILKLLLNKEHAIDLDSGPNGGFKKPIHVAAAYGRANIVRLLIDEGVDINSIGGRRKSALQYAIEYQANHIVKLLLDEGADINRQHDEDGNTALDTAILSQNEFAVREMLKRGVDYEVVKSVAIKNKKPDILKVIDNYKSDESNIPQQMAELKNKLVDQTLILENQQRLLIELEKKVDGLKNAKDTSNLIKKSPTLF